MARFGIQILLTIIAFGFLLSYVAECFMRNITTASGLLHQFFSMHDVHVGAYDDGFEYNGRWLSSPDQSWKEASFGGSSVQFSVTNTTSVILDLVNSAVNRSDDEIGDSDLASLILTPAKTAPRIEGPVSFFHTVNGSSNATYHRDAALFRTLAVELDPKATHNFKVTLPYHDESSVLQFFGLWLSKGGLLVRPGALKNGEEASSEAQNKSKSAEMLKKEDATSPRILIDITAPTPLLSHTCNVSDSTTRLNWSVNWPTLLQDHFNSSKFSTVPISSRSCLTSRCGDVSTRPQTTFFRAGPPNTTLHQHPWTFTSKTTTPGVLILTLGLSDVESFLLSSTHGKHDFTAFIDDLSHRYSTFIQMLRRTVYSPSSLASANNHIQNPLNNNNDYIDESHLYNSVPSILPIFVVLPPIPSALLVSHSRQIKSILHHTATKTLNDLKWHIGDQKTIIIDTAGWLADDDFIACPTTPSSPLTMNRRANASDFSLTQSGHIKFAHHLSLHLCPYISGGGKGSEKCSFEKHGEYVGNLVVPEVDGVGKIIERKRVARVKEIFGMGREGNE